MFKQVSTPNKLTNGKATKYGFGLFIDEFEGQPRIHHGGADTAYRSMMMYFPELDAAVIAQSNNAAFTRTIPESVARVFFEKDLGKKETVVSEETEPVRIDGEAFGKFVGRYELQEMAGVVLTFSQKEDKVFAQITGRPKSEMTQTSPSSFKINDVGAVVTFHSNEKGEMNTLTIKLS